MLQHYGLVFVWVAGFVLYVYGFAVALGARESRRWGDARWGGGSILLVLGGLAVVAVALLLGTRHAYHG